MAKLVFEGRSDRPIWGQLHRDLLAQKDPPLFPRAWRAFLGLSLCRGIHPATFQPDEPDLSSMAE